MGLGFPNNARALTHAWTLFHMTWVNRRQIYTIIIRQWQLLIYLGNLYPASLIKNNFTWLLSITNNHKKLLNYKNKRMGSIKENISLNEAVKQKKATAVKSDNLPLQCFLKFTEGAHRFSKNHQNL